MFRVPKRIEAMFGKRLYNAFQALVNRIIKGKKPVEELIREFVFSKETEEYIDNSIRKMINEQRVGSAQSWREAARRKAIAKEIVEYTKHEMQGNVGRRVAELVGNNSLYIKTLPSQWAEKASQIALRMTLEGKRPETIEVELRKIIPEEMQKNIKTIARTESAKANAAIAQARAEELGIKCYIWRTCNDERVRKSHAFMKGTVCFWNNPPAPEGRDYYHPGGTYNCRCYAEPVIDVKDLPNSMSVWVGDGVRKMSKKAFMKMYRGR